MTRPEPKSDTRMSENVRVTAVSRYHPDDRLVVRRCVYGDVALHQEGEGRSVYLERGPAIRFALRLLREALRQRIVLNKYWSRDGGTYEV